MKNLQKTNTNDFNKRSFNYLIEALRDENNEQEDAETVVRDFLARYEKEYNYEYNKKRYPNNQDRLSQFLQGLPTNLPFENFQILEDAKELHQCETLTEKEEDKILANHWNFWAFQILTIETLTLNKKLNNFLNTRKKNFSNGSV